MTPAPLRRTHQIGSFLCRLSNWSYYHGTLHYNYGVSEALAVRAKLGRLRACTLIMDRAPCRSQLRHGQILFNDQLGNHRITGHTK